MSSNGITSILRSIFEYLISFLFAQIPIFVHYVITLGKTNEQREKQHRVRAKLTNENDPSSPYRAVESLEKLQTQPEKKVNTLAVIPDLCLERYADKETMGVREIHNVEEEKQPNGKVYKKLIMGDYKYITYREAYARIDGIGRGFLSLGVQSGDKVLIFCETRAEWLLTAFAAFRHGLILVTLLPTLGEDGVKHAINESGAEVVVTSQELIPKIEKIFNQTKKVRYIVYFPALAKPEEAKVPKDKNNIQFVPLAKLEEQGQNIDTESALFKTRPKKDDIAVIMYTSGSTGTPKGVSITHESVIAAMTGQKERVFPILDVDNDVYIAYLPLAHILELSCEILVFYLGVKCGYSSPLTLTDQSTAIKRGEKGDLQVLRPHLMTCVPTILDRIHKTVNEKINANVFKRLFFNFAYTIKVKRSESGLASPYLDQWIFSRFNQLVLGGRVKALLCGGAVLSDDTQRFAEAALCTKVFQGYGLTETCAAGTIADQFDITSGRTGYPLVSCEIRLINWDEGQYKVTDKPNPRGEVLIGGKVVAQEYFGEEAAKENVNFKEFDGTRYFCTGDIGEVFPNGTLKIVDRKKDLIKLRGGEYVSLTKVETAISKSSMVENCCVCASSSSEHTVVLISPKPKEMESFASKHGGGKDWQQLVDDDKFNEEVLKEIQDACKKEGIQEYEIPQGVKVVTDPWTPDTGLVTDALKLKRKAIEQKYKDDIDQLYGEKSDDKKSKSKEKTSDSKEDATDVGEDVTGDDKKDQ